VDKIQEALNLVTYRCDGIRNCVGTSGKCGFIPFMGPLIFYHQGFPHFDVKIENFLCFDVDNIEIKTFLTVFLESITARYFFLFIQNIIRSILNFFY